MLISSTAALEIQKLTSTAALEAIQPEWRELWERCPRATPFQSPDWLLPWWQYLGGAGLHALALRDHEHRLVGLAPLFIWQPPATTDRRLLLVGTGVTDWLDALLDPPVESEGAAAIFRALESDQDKWDLCDLQDLDGDSPLLRAPAPFDWEDEIAQRDVSPVLKLPGDDGEELEPAAAGMLKRARYYARRLAKLAPVRIENATTENFQAAFDSFVRLHTARWQERQRPGVLANAAIENFHRAAALAFLARGALRLYALHLRDRVIATLYGFADATRAFYYLGGFDPEFARFSPGTILIGHAVEAALQTHATEFHFLRGSENYKYAWGAKDRPTYRRVLRAWRRTAGGEPGSPVGSR